MKNFFNAVANLFKSDPNKILDSGMTRLQAAILTNDLQQTVSLIKAGADVNFSGNLVFPPLHFALERDRHHIALALLQAGADVNLPDADGQVPLHHAAAQAQEAFVLALLKQGADPNIVDNAGQTPLHVMSTARPDIVGALTRHGADLNARDSDGNTALHGFLGHAALIERLLVGGADPNVKNNAGVSPYMMMLEEDRFQKYHKVLQHMLAFKADLGSTNTLGETVLHLAARLEATETFSTAFTRAQLGLTDQNGNNVLHAIVRTQNIEMVAMVLNRAPELMAQKNVFGMTPLGELIKRAERIPFKMDERFLAAARIMILKGADPSAVDDKGLSLLHHAVAQEKPDFIEFLIAKGINPNLLDKDGRGALHIAIEKKNMSILDMLLDRGADPDLTDARDWTVLDRLAEKGDRDSPLVQRLIVGGGQYQKQLPLHPELMRKRELGLGKPKFSGGHDFKA